jgi:hypothetical protein
MSFPGSPAAMQANVNGQGKQIGTRRVVQWILQSAGHPGRNETSPAALLLSRRARPTPMRRFSAWW